MANTKGKGLMKDSYFNKYEQLWGLMLNRNPKTKEIASITINEQYKVYFDDELDTIYNTLDREDIPFWLFDLAAELRKDLK